MAKSKVKVAVLISGRGSNLQSLIDACANEDFPAEIVAVISNVPDVYGLERAQNVGIEAHAIDHKSYESRENFESALIAKLQSYDADIVCLAGFMRILTPSFIDGLNASIINIHPSLLPKHKGLNTHARAIEAGDTEAGCSVHHVVADLDSGDVIVQKRVPVEKGDTAEALAARVLVQEHLAYPEALESLAKQLLDQ